MANEQQSKTNSGQQTRILPKNFRQIGEPGAKKIYMEDYVYTYLNKLAQPGNLYARGAILFGKMYKTAVGNCLFISGAAACQHFELDLEDATFSEENWNEIYRVRDKFFPEMDIVGWFLSRMGFSVELNDKIIRTHMDNFNGENKVLYMIDSLENEDAFYQFENYALRKQRGYYIYYETNKEMKNYMLAEGDMETEPETKRESTTILRDASVVKNYKKALKQKKSLRKKTRPTFSASSLAGALVVIMVLLYGFRSVQQFRQSQSTPVFEQQEEGKNVNMSQNNDTLMEVTTEGASENTKMTGISENDRENDENISSGTTEISAINQKDNELEKKQGADKTTEDNLSGISEEQTETDVDVFTQEEPDDVEETWSYIGGQYTVKQGDTLAGISKKIYQSYDYISLLAEANQIENVDQIYPGQVLNIPPIED